MRSGAPVRKLKLASGGRGEVRFRVTAEIVVVAPEDIEDLMRVNRWPLRGHGSGAYPGWRHQHCASQNTPCSPHCARWSPSPDSMAAVVPLQRERAGEAVPAARGWSDRYLARRCGDLHPEPSQSVGREARTACRYSSPAEFFAPAPL